MYSVLLVSLAPGRNDAVDPRVGDGLAEMLGAVELRGHQDEALGHVPPHEFYLLLQICIRRLDDGVSQVGERGGEDGLDFVLLRRLRLPLVRLHHRLYISRSLTTELTSQEV